LRGIEEGGRKPPFNLDVPGYWPAWLEVFMFFTRWMMSSRL
jgi:hypothetical protein